jgi:hypothetical protein
VGRNAAKRAAFVPMKTAPLRSVSATLELLALRLQRFIRQEKIRCNPHHLDVEAPLGRASAGWRSR